MDNLAAHCKRKAQINYPVYLCWTVKAASGYFRLSCQTWIGLLFEFPLALSEWTQASVRKITWDHCDKVEALLTEIRFCKNFIGADSLSVIVELSDSF